MSAAPTPRRRWPRPSAATRTSPGRLPSAIQPIARLALCASRRNRPPSDVIWRAFSGKPDMWAPMQNSAVSSAASASGSAGGGNGCRRRADRRRELPVQRIGHRRPADPPTRPDRAGSRRPAVPFGAEADRHGERRHVAQIGEIGERAQAGGSGRSDRPPPRPGSGRTGRSAAAARRTRRTASPPDAAPAASSGTRRTHRPCAGRDPLSKSARVTGCRMSGRASITAAQRGGAFRHPGPVVQQPGDRKNRRDIDRSPPSDTPAGLPIQRGDFAVRTTPPHPPSRSARRPPTPRGADARTARRRA